MLKLLLAAALALAGCGEADPAPLAELAGGWNYTWTGLEVNPMHGGLTVMQDGDRVTGALDLPRDATVDPQFWFWELAGTAGAGTADLEASVMTTCACPDVAPWAFHCTVAAGQLSCAATHPGTAEAGTFSAVFAGP